MDVARQLTERFATPVRTLCYLFGGGTDENIAALASVIELARAHTPGDLRTERDVGIDLLGSIGMRNGHTPMQLSVSINYACGDTVSYHFQDGALTGLPLGEKDGRTVYGEPIKRYTPQPGA